MLDKITKSGYLIIRIVTGILTAILLLYCTFTFWDMYRGELRAFASYDLLKYRPNIEEEEPPYLDDLVKINPDVAGWLTIYGTNIDYPVFQGESDNEYLNKNAYGEYTISGSIFMSVKNKKDFSDPYTLIYGHHMENGSMFGDIDKFKDKDFFYNKNKVRCKKEEGVLIMQEKVYNLKVIALVETDAYDRLIYMSDKTQEELQDLLTQVKGKCKYYIEDDGVDKVLALSTCNDATSFARTVVLCKMTIRTDPLPTREEEPLTPHRKAIGHPMSGAYWALLNLFCFLLTLIAAFPVHLWLKKDIRQKLDKRYAAAAVVAGLASVAVFLITENPQKPIQFIDPYTPVMLILLIAVWLLQCKASSISAKDLLRKQKEEETEEEEKEVMNNGS